MPFHEKTEDQRSAEREPRTRFRTQGQPVGQDPIDQKIVKRDARHDARLVGSYRCAAKVFEEIVDNIHGGVGHGARPELKGLAWTSDEGLAEVLGLSERTVRNCLWALRELGYILTTGKGRFRTILVLWPDPGKALTQQGKGCDQPGSGMPGQPGNGAPTTEAIDRTDADPGPELPFAPLTSESVCQADRSCSEELARISGESAESVVAAAIQEEALSTKASSTEPDRSADQMLIGVKSSEEGSEPLPDRPGQEEQDRPEVQELMTQLLWIMRETKPRTAALLWKNANADWRAAGPDSLGAAVNRLVFQARIHVGALQPPRAPGGPVVASEAKADDTSPRT